MKGFSFLLLAMLALHAASPAVGDDSRDVRAVYTRASIILNGRAKAPGVIRVTFWMAGGKPHEIKVTVVGNMGENRIAKAIAEELASVAPAEYQIKRRKGEWVRVWPTRRDTTPFGLEVASNVPGLSLKIKD